MTLIITTGFFVTSEAFADNDFFSFLFGNEKNNNNADDGLFYGFVTISVDNDGNVFTFDSSKQRIQKFSPEGEFLAKLGSLGSADGEFRSSTDMAFDSNGNVYVSDRHNNSIQKFSPEGEFLAKWKGTDFEKEKGRFVHPQFIAIDSKDNVYVLDTKYHEILKFSNKVEFLAKWDVYNSDKSTVDFNTAHLFSIDSNDNIYVADIHHVKKFSPDGNLILEWEPFEKIVGDLPNSVVVAIDFSGNSYLVDSQQQKISVISSDGTPVSSQLFDSSEIADIPMLSTLGITFDKKNNIYFFDVLDFNVKKFDRDGILVTSFGSKVDLKDVLRNPGKLTVDLEDNLYVETGKEIWKFSRDGKLIDKLNLKINNHEITDLTNMLFDFFGNMYVSNQQHRIAEFTNEGNFVKEYGIFTPTEHYMLPSISIALDSNDDLYAIESENRIIQKFTSDGKFITEWGFYDGENYSSSLVPTAIAVDRHDNIYVAFQMSLIQKFTSDGKFITEWESPENGKGQFYNVFSIETDSENNVYVAALEHDKIIQFTSDGKFITEFGSTGTGYGKFKGISGIAIDSDDNVYVSDSVNDVVQKFDRDSVFITKTKNLPPIANAGDNQYVDEGAQITLDGTKSFDQDKIVNDIGEIPEEIRFQWRQIEGPVARISDKTIANPVVEIPIIDDEKTVLSFELTVTDYVGMSSSDTVDIQVNAKKIPKSSNLSSLNLSNSGSDYNPHNAVISASENYVYVLWSQPNQENTELVLSTSNDNGKTFHKTTTIIETQNPISNISLISSENNVYAIWTEYSKSRSFTTFLGSSNDYGENFLHFSKFDGAGIFPIDVFASGDNVYVAWLPINQNTGLPDTIHFESSNNAGKTFFYQPIQVGQTSVRDVKVFSSQDKIKMVWISQNQHGNEAAFYMQSSDSIGERFDEPIEITSNVVSIDSVIIDKNDIYVLFYKQELEQTPSTSYSFGKVSLFQSVDNGKSFVEIFASEDPDVYDEVKEYGHRDITISDGSIHLTWTEYSHTEGIKIYVLSSIDGGDTFSKTFVDDIQDLPFGSDLIYFDETDFPFNIEANGKDLRLIYQKPIKSGDDIHSFVVTSHDYGKTFEKRIRLGQNIEEYSEFLPRMTSSTLDGSIHIIWISGKFEIPYPINSDVFYSKISNQEKDFTQKQPLEIHPSPLKQFTSGIPMEQIQCNKDLVLIQRYDERPACVTSDTLIELSKRGVTFSR